MRNEQLVVNTLVFLERMNAGVLQADFLEELHRLKLTGVEVRREFFHDFAAELPAIARAAQEYNMELFYSVPAYLYENKKLMAEQLESFYAEAQTMGCHNVKLNIGEYGTLTHADIEKIETLSDQYHIRLTVENNQTPEDGRCEKIKAFLLEARALGGKIGFTFDTGNWLWVGEDPHRAAQELYPFVTYIHVKDVLPGTPAAALHLGDGCLDWQRLLQELPAGLPVALEYPCSDVAAEAAVLLATPY